MKQEINLLNECTVEDQTFYNTALLKRFLPKLSFYADAKKKKIPKGKGTSIEWRKFKSLTPAKTPLSEGITPNGSKTEIIAITAKLQQYGDYIVTSDVYNTQSKDPVLTENAQLLGEQAGLTVNSIMADELSKGTSVRYAGGKTSTEDLTDADVLTGKLVKMIARDLAANNVPKFDDGYYHATITPEQAYNLKNDTEKGGWIDANMYNNRMALIKNELGCYGGFRFIESTEAPKKLDGAVHCGIFYGKDTYGVPEIGADASHPKLIVKPLGSAGTTDPLNQRSSTGWKNMFAIKRLEELGIIRCETRVSD